MVKNNIILTGFMATGKTTIGKILASQLGYSFVDTDEIIVERAGRSIATIFKEDGEDKFRELERSIAAELAQRRGLVIATGGRLMLDELNAQALEPTGQVYCLTADAADIVSRLEKEPGQRPLLDDPDPRHKVQSMLDARAAGYRQFPQVYTSGKNPEEIAKKIKLLMKFKIIPVSYPHGQYNVIAGSDILPDVRQVTSIRGPMLVITDSNVGPLYAEKCPADAGVVTIPAGEPYKTLETVHHIYDQLLALDFDRQGTILALGGGVVGDVAGFVAATYMRGVDLIQCPTSLLAMVDASVGGKTGVDLPQGKNLIGAFKQPLAVLLDVNTLLTLPVGEFNSGMAEVIKAGLIGDRALFSRLETKTIRPLEDPADLAEIKAAVLSAVRVKRDIVQEDPFEKGRRAVLNLGHTFGHAVEQVSNYEIRHGEAVAIGMVIAAYLSWDLGYCDRSLPDRIESVLLAHGLPIRIPASLPVGQILKMMGSDKKKVGGQLRFILLRDLGDVFITADVPERAINNALSQCRAG